MINVERIEIMEKKVYIQPATDISNLIVQNVMLTISSGGTPPDEGPAHAPKHGDIIP